MTITATPTFTIDETDVDALPPFGNPRKRCPLQARYWEFRLQYEAPRMTFEEWLQLREQYLELRELDGVIRETKFEVWAYKQYMHDTVEQCYAAYDPNPRMTSSVPNIIETEEFWTSHTNPVFEPILSTPTHKVAEPTTSPSTLAALVAPAPVKTLRSCRQARTKKSPHVTADKKRPLTMYEKRQLKNGTIPFVLESTPHLVRLELREHLWHAQAKISRRNNRRQVARFRAYIARSA